MRSIKKIDGLLGPWSDRGIASDFKGPSGHKFLNRDKEIRISWSRLHQYAKDILLSEKTMRVLDVGCGSGATLEVFRYYGHKAVGLDYSTGKSWDNDWIYSPMIKSQGLSCRLHNGSDLPYPFKENEFDLVICWSAITFFKPVKKWPHILDEFARLSKSAIIVAPNAGQVYDRGRPLIEAWKPPGGFRLTESHAGRYRWDKRG